MPKGVEVFTDPLVRPVGADTVVPFSQSKAKVVLYGGTARDGFSFDGKLRGDNLTDFQRNCFAHEVCRWDYVHQQFPDYVATKNPDPSDYQPPLTDERQIRKEFLHKARFDPEGAVLQLMRTRDALLKRWNQWKIAEDQNVRARMNNGQLMLQPGEIDQRSSLSNRKHWMKGWRNKWTTRKQALNPAWTDGQRYLSFAICNDASKTIVMSPTFFSRCDAFKVAYKSEGTKFSVGAHEGPGPCQCPEKVGEQHKLGHEILQNSCFTCCHPYPNFEES